MHDCAFCLEKNLASVNEKFTTFPARGKRLSEDTSQDLNSMVNTHCSRFGDKRIGKETSDVIFSSSFLNGIVKDEIIRRSRKELKNVFSPRNF